MLPLCIGSGKIIESLQGAGGMSHSDRTLLQLRVQISCVLKLRCGFVVVGASVI